MLLLRATGKVTKYKGSALTAAALATHAVSVCSAAAFCIAAGCECGDSQIGEAGAGAEQRPIGRSRDLWERIQSFVSRRRQARSRTHTVIANESESGLRPRRPLEERAKRCSKFCLTISLVELFETPGERVKSVVTARRHVREQADVQATLVKVRAHTKTSGSARERRVREVQGCNEQLCRLPCSAAWFYGTLATCKRDGVDVIGTLTETRIEITWSFD